MNTILNTFSRKQYYIFALRLGLKVIQIKGEDQKTRNFWGGVVLSRGNVLNYNNGALGYACPP